MPLVLDAAVGGVGSNSFLTRAAAQAILDTVPNAGAWTGASSDDVRDQALVHATSMLTVLAYQGRKTYGEQALAWPRSCVVDPDYGDDAYPLNATTIPRRVQRATALLALEILRAGTKDVWGVDAKINVRSESIDVIRKEYLDPGQRRRGLRAFPQVWREIAPLTTSADAGRVVRA